MNNGNNSVTSAPATLTVAEDSPSIDIADNPVYLRKVGSNLQYSKNNTAWTTYTSQLTITGPETGTSPNTVNVLSGTHDVTFNGLKISSSSASAVSVASGATLNLTLSGTNSLTTSRDNYAGVSVSSGATLTINGSDSDNMTANGGMHGAGIGSGQDGTVGTINIKCGTVNAYGGSGSAGIGGGYKAEGGTIKISGGKVIAKGGSDGAGIGGGNEASGGKITIDSGDIEATGGQYGAGIGSGQSSIVNINGGDITIKGGKIKAAGGGRTSAGIGGGYDGEKATSLSIREQRLCPQSQGHRRYGRAARIADGARNRVHADSSLPVD